MSGKRVASSHLTWEVLALRRPGLTRDLPHPRPNLEWVANSVTLISGRHDAVLVDTFLTKGQSRVLVEWVARTGKNLIAIYVTHPHGDHFFGLGPLLERFPHARAIATPAVAKAMRKQLAPERVDGFWHRLFPGEIPERLVVAEPLEAVGFELEGEPLIAVDAGHTDTTSSTSLHVPSLDLMVAGDVVYNGIHLHLAETDVHSRVEWISALDRLETLKPQAVVAGHKVPENADDPRDIARTRQYLRDFNSLDQTTATPEELYEAMLELYPDRANPGALWSSAIAAKKLSGVRH